MVVGPTKPKPRFSSALESAFDSGEAVGTSAGTVGRWSVVEPDRPVGVKLWARARQDRGFVLGGTAWTFTDVNQVERKQLDLLVIDEAGQFSIANTIARPETANA